jgi:hypothetical protein
MICFFFEKPTPFKVDLLMWSQNLRKTSENASAEGEGSECGGGGLVYNYTSFVHLTTGDGIVQVPSHFSISLLSISHFYFIVVETNHHRVDQYFKIALITLVY